MGPTSPQTPLCEYDLLILCIKGKPPRSTYAIRGAHVLPEHILPKWCIHKHFKGTLTKILMKRIHCDGKTVRNLVIKRWYSFKCNLPIIQQEW